MSSSKLSHKRNMSCVTWLLSISFLLNSNGDLPTRESQLLMNLGTLLADLRCVLLQRHFLFRSQFRSKSFVFPPAFSLQLSMLIVLSFGTGNANRVPTLQTFPGNLHQSRSRLDI